MTDQSAAAGRVFAETQRKRLEALRAQLLGGEMRSMAQERTLVEDHGEEPEEPEDAGQRMAQNEIDQALHDADAQRIRAIDRALLKIDEGTYGLSDLSGKPIPKARLEATPEAVLTVEEEEQKEREQSRA